MKLRVRHFMKELGFRECGDTIYGVVDGYLVSIADKDGVASLFIDIYLSGSEDIQREKIRNFIESDTTQFSILRAEVTKTGILIYFDGSPSGFGRLKDFLFIIVRQLAAIGIPGASVCGNCGRPITSVAVVHIDGRLHTCDTECGAALETRAEQAGKNKPKRRARFIPGVFGALFGAVLAVVPYTLLFRTGLFMPWYGLLTALFVKGGYELFGGKPSFGKSAAVLLSSFLSSAASVFLSYCFSLLRVWNGGGYRFLFAEAFGEVANDLLAGGMLRLPFLTDTGVLFGFALLGLLLLLRFRKKDDPRRVYVLG